MISNQNRFISLNHISDQSIKRDNIIRDIKKIIGSNLISYISISYQNIIRYIIKIIGSAGAICAYNQSIQNKSDQQPHYVSAISGVITI